MPFLDITKLIQSSAPDLKGRLLPHQPLAPFTWFRVGGVAQLMYLPQDEEDLAYFLAQIPPNIPVHILGLGSNMIIRDGGVPGVVLRLGGKGFGEIDVLPDGLIKVGACVPDMKLAKVAADAERAGLTFFRGIPGSIGGAIAMNAGAHGGETKDVLQEIRAVSRAGKRVIFKREDINFSYRHCGLSQDFIFTSAIFHTSPGKRSQLLSEMEDITQKREASQPIREKTGGSTFKNPPHHKAWQLIDQAGCRGLAIGDAQVSSVHCNFLINRGKACAADIEALGEEVRRRVHETSGIMLEWEIKRIGIAGKEAVF